MVRTKGLIAGIETRNGQHANLQTIKAKLEQNSLVELRLGFEGGEFRSKRDVESLIQTIQGKFHRQISLHKYSCLKSISIGWKLPNFALGPVLQSVIPNLLQEPVRVKHLQLVLNDNPPIPEGCLRRILSWHSLESLDLRSITIRVVSVTSPPRTSPPKQPQSTNRKQYFAVRTNNTRSKKVGSSSEESRNWKRANIVDILPYVSSNITTLKLMCCGINKHQIQKICHHIRHRMHSLKRLSLRQNFTMDGGYDELFGLRGIRDLDLSLCDLDHNDGYCISRAIQKSENEDLRELCLAGNYRLSASVSEIIRAGATKLSHMDCSFCEVSTKTQQRIFEILAKEPSPSSITRHDCQSGYTIRSLRMRSCTRNTLTCGSAVGGT